MDHKVVEGITINDISQELIKVAKTILSGPINMWEKGDVVYIKGDFNSIRPFLKRLRNNGFDFDRPSKTWYAANGNISKRGFPKLKKDMGLDVPPIDPEQQKKIVFGIFNKYSFSHFLAEANKTTLFVKGDTYDLRHNFNDAGFHWASTMKGYISSYEAINLDKLKILLKLMKEQDEDQDDRIDQVRKYVKGLITTSWLGGRISIQVGKNKITISTSSSKYRNLIKSVFVYSKWNGSAWEVPYKKTDIDEIQSFVKEAENLEDNFQKTMTEENGKGNNFMFNMGSGYGGDRYSKGLVFHRDKTPLKDSPEWIYILDVKSTYFSEDGLSFGVGEDEGYMYHVYYREATSNEYAPYIVKQQKSISKSEALKELNQIAKDIRKNGTHPKGMNKPKGDQIYLNKNSIIYGSGSWFVIGSGKIWFVENNGADGDNWDYNNVSTGGAGAIGWYISFSDKLADRINQLSKMI